MKIKKRRSTNIFFRRFGVATLLLFPFAVLLISDSLHKQEKVVIQQQQQQPLTKEDLYGAIPETENEEESPDLPHVSLLLSFPSSGTAFTMFATMLMSNSTAGTNYYAEVPRKADSSIMFRNLVEKKGDGPYFLEEKDLKIPKKYVLTKTHCTGYANDGPIEGYIINPQRFAIGCAQTHRWSEKENTMKLRLYDHRIMPKTAVRLVRNPFDNVVSNFHSWVYGAMPKDDPLAEFAGDDVKMFHEFCKKWDNIFEEKMEEEQIALFKDPKVKEGMKGVPCHQFFFRWVQWHNNVNHLSREMNVHLIRYEDYETNYKKTMSGLLDFLELEETVGGRENDVVFKKGNNKYHMTYYTKEEKEAISNFLRLMADPATLDLLSNYLD